MMMMSIPQSLLPDGLLPHELEYHFLDAAQRDVRVEADIRAILAEWGDRSRVELMLAGRALVLESDLDGLGVRVVDPISRMPLAVFRPARRGGRVDLPDGGTLRWLAPTRSIFESGFVTAHQANIIRFAHDGTATILVDAVDLAGGAVPARAERRRAGRFRDDRTVDVLMLLVLGWFLRLVGELDDASGDRRRTRRGTASTPDFREGRPAGLRQEWAPLAGGSEVAAAAPPNGTQPDRAEHAAAARVPVH
jgi:hypothetical protein